MPATDKTWDIIIEPRGSLFKLNLNELWRYRDLLEMYIKRDIVTSYKQTILGPVWFFIQPVFTTIVYVFVFGGLAGYLLMEFLNHCFIFQVYASGTTFRNHLIKRPILLFQTRLFLAKFIFREW